MVPSEHTRRIETATMNSILNQASLLAALLAAMSIGPITAIGLLRLRKYRARAERRSPINVNRPGFPGDSLV